ncbi:MAG TPA: terminase large subunit, partial [Planctomycetota bacterium]|nr:terminase large subunit [Planctomycetota bacterium]
MTVTKRKRTRSRPATVPPEYLGIPGYDPRKGAGARAFRFDRDLADRACGFFPDCLQHVKGKWAGQPFKLEPWQTAFVGTLFGWVHRETGMRRYREALLFVARKNGKSPLAAGIALYCFLADGEPGAEVAVAAGEREQATLTWSMAEQMVQRNPDLRRVCKVYSALRSIVLPQNGSTFKPLSWEPDTKQGMNIHAAVVDELHIHRSAELVDVIQRSTSARQQPLVLYTTTSDYERESICNDKYDYACKVRDGAIDDPQFLPCIYEAPRNTRNIESRRAWQAANPNLGISKSIDYMIREAKKAKANPSSLSAFKRYELNIRTEAAARWIDMLKWDGCHGGEPSDPMKWRLARLADRGRRPCWGGLDVASTSDMTAFVLLWEDDVAIPWYWVPATTAGGKDRGHRLLYEQWIEQGWLISTPGDMTDFIQVREDIIEICKPFGVVDIRLDRYRYATELCSYLQNAKLDMVAMGQGYASMTAP